MLASLQVLDSRFRDAPPAEVEATAVLVAPKKKKKQEPVVEVGAAVLVAPKRLLGKVPEVNQKCSLHFLCLMVKQ